MKVLDIDLDFFQSETIYWGDSELTRPNDQGVVPWTEQEVRSFLELQCGLNRRNPIPGITVTDHHGVFWFWKRLIQEGRLSVPFDVVHVDAHADLGLGDASWAFIMRHFLHIDPEERQAFDNFGDLHGLETLAMGNYLAFAVACRWLQSLTFVPPDRWDQDDLQWLLFKDFNAASGIIQLRKYSRDARLDVDRIRSISPVGFEPEIPFKVVHCSRFGAVGEPFSFASLSRSPNYTVPSVDRLVPIIEEYILLD